MPAEDLPTLAERFVLPGGYIRQAGGMAVAHATLEGRSTVTVPDGRAACRSLRRRVDAVVDADESLVEMHIAHGDRGPL